MARSAFAPPLQKLLQRAIEGDDSRTSIDDILDGLKQLETQREAAIEADEYYEGDVGMVYASAAVRRLLGKQNVEDIEDFNYAKVPVDVVANRLQISGIAVAPAEENEGEEETTEDASTTAAEKAIARLRKRNQLDAEEKRLHHEVSRYGQSFLLVWPVTDDAGTVVDVDMRVNSPHNVAMIYDPDDQLKPLYVIKHFTKGDEEAPIHRVNLYYFGDPDTDEAGRIERWSTRAGGNPDRLEDWFKLVDAPEELPDVDMTMEELTADELNDETGEDKPNPWGQVWFHFRNHRPEGIPEHKGAYGPQQMINKMVYAHAGVIDYQSFPQRYLLVDPLQDDPLVNLNDPDHPDDDDDDPETDAGTSGLNSDPAEVWKLFGKSTGQYQAADPDVFLRPFDRYIKAMAELTDTPQHAFSKASGDMPSGEAARELNAPTTTKVEDRQSRYEPEWEGAYELALKMLGIEGVTVDVRWKPQQMVNDLAGWQVVQAKIAAGVPPEVALQEAGYPPEQVTEWLKDATGADLGRRVAILNQIGTAVQTLGAGIALGATSAEQVRAVISAVLGLTVAGTDPQIMIPDADDFVDPQAALKAQQELADKQQQGQQTLQETALEHQKRMAAEQHERQRQMAQEGHERAKEMLRETPAGGGRTPGGRNGRNR